MAKIDWALARQKMVTEQIEARGIRSKFVLNVMRSVPRHYFVDTEFQDQAYADMPLSIGLDQTISQPFIVALMSEKLELTGTEKVLEIGTGSGYQTAILAAIAEKVYTVERYPELSNRAQQILKKCGYQNVFFHVGDGSVGLKEFALYDRIIVTAGAPDIPDELVEQLIEGGKVIVPVGNTRHQNLLLCTKEKNGLIKEKLCGCIFVPLIGQSGWKSSMTDMNR